MKNQRSTTETQVLSREQRLAAGVQLASSQRRKLAS